MPLVAGVDSSTQSCKVVVRDAETGALVRSGRAAHPEGTEVAPSAWWAAFEKAAMEAGGLDDVSGLSIAGQQHGLIMLDEDGQSLRDALLWHDTRSAQAAEDLVLELGEGDRDRGARRWAEAVGTVPVAALTVAKLRWVAEHEPAVAARVAAVALPHDWLTAQLLGVGPEELVTDRSDASGTGYWSPQTAEYRDDLLEFAFGRSVRLPRVLAPAAVAGEMQPSEGAATALLVGPGAGDNAAAALGLGLETGDAQVSIGTSGVVAAVMAEPAADASGLVSGFADATGRFLPLACTLNAARVLDAGCRLLRVNHGELSRLALSAPVGADGLVLVPYLEGERTPNRPEATGSFHGLRLNNASPAHVARAVVEGLLCGLADALDALRAQTLEPQRLFLVGGGARSEAVRALAPSILGAEVVAPPPGEYVADGAARQAAWVLEGGRNPPTWQHSLDAASTYRVDPVVGPSWLRDRYAAACRATFDRWVTEG